MVVLLAAFIGLTLALHGKDKVGTAEKKGNFTHENVYSNPALGMTIALPGAWQFFEKETQKRMGVGEKHEEPSKPDPACKGPFCAGTEIDVALLSKELPSKGAIFLIGYKVPKEFLDRRRYPLKMFAEAMANDSVEGGNWIISAPLAPCELDKKPAYRLLVHKPVPGGEGKGFGYVAESSGYVFLLVGTVPDIVSGYPEQLQSALENMKLSAGMAQ